MSPRRATVASFGPSRGGVRVVDDPKQREGYYIVQWSVTGVRRIKTFPRTKEGRAEAIAFAQGVWDTKRGTKPQPRLTLRALWEAYVTSVWDSLRPLTQRNYRRHWMLFETFLGREMIAEDVRAEDLDRLRQSLRPKRSSVGDLQRMVTNIKTVYRWGTERDLLARDRVSSYRFRIAKEDRPKPPGEYAAGEPERILTALTRTRHRSDGWRPWALVLLAMHTGKRMHQLLHLRVEDVQGDLIRWPADWEKMGQEKSQPLTWGALSAVLTALAWRARDGYEGPWLFYSSHAKKRALGADPKAVYDKASLWLALQKAERAAQVTHRPRVAMHGFRRRVAGDILEATRDAKLALDYIGDTDLRQASRYLQPRDGRMDEAAGIIDGDFTPKPSTKRQRKATASDRPETSEAGQALADRPGRTRTCNPLIGVPSKLPHASTKTPARKGEKPLARPDKSPKTTPKPSTNRQRRGAK